ncbi:hypothetical protein DFH07DRAFT_767170 [Mycena maculata]|uniref:Uncharacterized protein n=1 Tax=Mycena maculata TaxID=230809 RepID=A0AAD7K2T5_9AGAR|nr:hypothetical protein DFH07DRAFT_767170 [Mycena maculata]
MRLHFIIYALISVLYVGALPTDRNDKRSDPPTDTRTPYQKCLDNGNKVLKEIAGDTADLSSDYDKLYRPFTRQSKLTTTTGVGKTIKNLVGINLSPDLEIMKVGRTEDEDDVAYENYFDVAHGLIVGASNYNDIFFNIPTSKHPDPDLPEMTSANSLHWAQFVGEQYKSLRGSLADLQHILRFDIDNKVTQGIIKQALTVDPPLPVQGKWTVITPTGPTEDLFTALLGTNNGQGAGFMLKDYKSTMRGKTIQAIRVQSDGRDYHMIIDYSLFVLIWFY